MKENINIFNFELSPEDMALIATLDTGKSTIIDAHDMETARWMSGLKMEL